jgi:hypothetical protein
MHILWSVSPVTTDPIAIAPAHQVETKETIMNRIIVGLIGSSLAIATTSLHADERGMNSSDARTVIQSWPKEAKKSAEMMIQKYGTPDEITAMRLVWHDNGPWKRTIVTKEETDHAFPMPHKDVLEQVIDYRVPTDKVDELAKYDGSVIVERTKGELSARCDKEEANFLALNLANDVATGKKEPEEAREEYAKTIKDLMAGKKDPYVQKLQFAAQRSAADPDKPAMIKQAKGD